MVITTKERKKTECILELLPSKVFSGPSFKSDSPSFLPLSLTQKFLPVQHAIVTQWAEHHCLLFVKSSLFEI